MSIILLLIGIADARADETDMDDDRCPTVGQERVEFSAEHGEALLDARAGDFTLNTLIGTWNFASEFSGCDSYVVIRHIDDERGQALNDSLTGALFDRSATNVHYFFVSSAEDVTAAAKDMRDRVQVVLANLSPQEYAHWTDRVHFGTDRPTDIEGSLGEFFAANPDSLRAVAIDRAQRWDYPGSYWDTPLGYFAPDINVFGYSSRYYNVRYAQDQRLAHEEDVTVVAMMDQVEFAPDCVVGEPCFDVVHGPFSNSNNNRIWPVVFPDADTMEDFDTMEFDLQASCGPSPYADCGHWDYEAFIQYCHDPDCSQADEIIRWITPYARPGTRRWTFDVTAFLPLVRQGGLRYFRFGMLWNMNPNTWDMHFRLKELDRDAKPFKVISSFSGNRQFGPNYNWDTQTFVPPPGTRKVELVAIISGHGQVAPDYCAEWCNHQHLFTINNQNSYMREFPNQVLEQRCAEEVELGVIPGQWGNWTPGRAGWCPGQVVSPWIVDITNDVLLGEENSIDYRGMFANMEPQGGRIRINTYIVYSR